MQENQLEGVMANSDTSPVPFFYGTDSKPETEKKMFNVNFLSRFDEIYLNSKMLGTAFYDYQLSRGLHEAEGETTESPNMKRQNSDVKIPSAVGKLSRSDSAISVEYADEDFRREPFVLRSFPFDEEISKSQMIRGKATEFE